MSFVLLIAAVWHLVSISFFGIFGFILLLLAAIFAWFSRKPADVETQPGGMIAGETEPAGADPRTALRRLEQLKEESLITPEEYEEKRRALLEQI